MIHELHLARSDHGDMLNHAENTLPLESVALLFGVIEEPIVYVRRVVRVSNASESPTRFSVEPEEQYRLYMEAESLGEELVGIFHSHPAPPHPSATDLRYMKLNPVVWLIASKVTGEWRTAAFILENDTLSQVTVRTI